MRVTFRATFQGRKGKLETPGFRFPNPPLEQIEIFRRVDSWYAKAASTGHEIKALRGEPSHGAMKDAVADAFEKQVTEWTMYDAATHQPLDASRVDEDPKGNFTIRDYFHVGREYSTPQEATEANKKAEKNQNHFETACGQAVHVRLIRSRRGQNPPDCPTCRKAWEQVAPGDRLK